MSIYLYRVLLKSVRKGKINVWAEKILQLNFQLFGKKRDLSHVIMLSVLKSFIKFSH